LFPQQNIWGTAFPLHYTTVLVLITTDTAVVKRSRHDDCSRPSMPSRCSANQETPTPWRTRHGPIRRQRCWRATSLAAAACGEVHVSSVTARTVRWRYVPVKSV